ncbi:glycosyl transferase [Pilobolus umbonatus]|nr:glycosyl transferase [Pilobolus umbonatus]
MPKLTRRLTNVIIHVDADKDSVETIGTDQVPSREPKNAKLDDNTLKEWKQYIKPKENDKESIKKDIVHQTVDTLCRGPYNLDKLALYQATAYAVRERLQVEWDRTQAAMYLENPKRCYYLSMEFLIGRALDNALHCLKIKDAYKDAVKDLGFNLEDLLDKERDAALGNGGLGRLAACYMDSAATLDYPTWGYGIRYQYGIFKQLINEQGYQTEVPDYWLDSNNPWEFPRTNIRYEVQFYGYVATKMNDKGESRMAWEGGEKVIAVAYDVPIPGFGTRGCGNIRLWSAKAIKGFDFAAFNDGDYDRSVASQKSAENLTAVLYPNDNHVVGKELRLKQEYFFVSASLQDIIHRFKRCNTAWKDFPEKVAVQLNDTHPTLAIPELQRILMDVEGLEWDAAFDIVTRVFAFTNHTVLPEALECWSVPMMEKVLPRHMQIVYDINLFFLQKVERMFAGDRELLKRVSIIEESSPQQVRMAYLAVVGSHTVNGVAALHSELIKTQLFNDFIKYYGPEKFVNITNGITPRRWLYQANPDLRDLITETLGSQKWVTHLDELSVLNKHADDVAFQTKWMNVKLKNKARLANYIKTHLGIEVDPHSLFDIQVKRIHEYKRQFMNILSVIYRYKNIKTLDDEEKNELVPRVVIFGGKSAPGYYIAKMVIKLITTVADVVNNDTSIGNLLKVVYIPDYSVSLAEIITPASDISQHISTAGTEASGTSNMKFVLNGGLILGTLDGANIEIRNEIGKDNIFMFGTLSDQVADIRHKQKYHGVLIDSHLQVVLQAIQAGEFGGHETASVFGPLINTLTYGGDYYLISADFEQYLDAHDLVDATFKDKKVWAKKSILCTAGMGFFSSDRATREYADKIWQIKPYNMSDLA